MDALPETYSMDPTFVQGQLEITFRVSRMLSYEEPLAQRMRELHQAVTNVRLAMRHSPWTQMQLQLFKDMLQTRGEIIRALNTQFETANAL